MARDLDLGEVVYADMHRTLDNVIAAFESRDWRAKSSYEFSLPDGQVGDLRITLFERPPHDAYPELDLDG